MAEYIEREAALRVLCDACGNAACPKGLIPRCSYYEKMQSIHAADAIEELMRRCEQFQYMPPPAWIPVTERLPKEGEFVLVYGDLYPNKRDGGVIAVSKRMDWNYWQGFGRERDITHWMPLPTPPQAEEGVT